MTDYRRLYILCIIICIVVAPRDLLCQADAVVVEWGETMANPELGFNGRIRTEHQLPFCEQPEPSDSEFDWNNLILREKIAEMNPGNLRFPGGTPANYWIWEDEVQEVYNADGSTELLNLCEGSVIGRTYSADIGCSGIVQNLDYNALSQIYSNSTVTLSSYISTVADLRSRGIELSEIFMLGVFDPRYYVGSPQLEFETQGWPIGSKRSKMKTKGIQRAEAQLDKILYEYCGDCESYDAAFSFELGNELHLKRFGKFMPSPDCFSASDICEDCLPDVDFYADICEVIIPIIRSKFPNAKIAVNGSRDLAGEPWNQVIIDRLASGPSKADASMMHFYPKSTNPDSLTLELCQGLEGSYDIENVLHYQQVFTDFLFDQRNVDLFKQTDLELWFTEFNNYDYSELCTKTFGVSYEDDEHLYDSGNWLHALNVLNLFNKFTHYKCSNLGPWSEVDHGNNITKLCFHLMFGPERETAIRPDLEYSPAGLAMGSLMNALQATDSFNLLLISPPEAIILEGEGNWSPANESEGIPWMYDLEYTDKNGNRLTAETWDTYGWSFISDDRNKAIIVNLKGASLDLDISNLTNYAGDTYFKSYKVPKHKLGTTLEDGESSLGLFISEGVTAQSNVLIPPYSFTVIEMDFSFPRPDNNGCPSAADIMPSVIDEDDWRTFFYSGAGGVKPSCIDDSQVNDIWFKFTPVSRDEIIMVRDTEERLDLVIEVYGNCGAPSLGCLDSYGLGETEIGFINDLNLGQEYRFRVYAKDADPLHLDFIEVQVKTTSVGGIEDSFCGNYGLDDADQIQALGPEEIYGVDPGVDAYRFKFIPESGGQAIIYKNEDQVPYTLPLALVDGLQDGENYTVKVQHRIAAEANGTSVSLWSESDAGCQIGISNNCNAFLNAPVGLTKSLEPVNGVINRLQLKWFKELPEVPFSIADSAACDFEFWPVKDLSTNIPIPNGAHSYLTLKKKPAQEFFKWPIKFNRPDILPNLSYKWKVRCACEYGNGPMSPWSEEKFFNTPDYDPLTNIYTPPGGIIADLDEGKSLDWLKISEEDKSSRTMKFITSLDLEDGYTLEVFDLRGSRIPNFDVALESRSSFTLNWDSNIKEGLYLIRLYNGETSITTVQFITY